MEMVSNSLRTRFALRSESPSTRSSLFFAQRPQQQHPMPKVCLILSSAMLFPTPRQYVGRSGHGVPQTVRVSGLPSSRHSGRAARRKSWLDNHPGWYGAGIGSPSTAKLSGIDCIRSQRLEVCRNTRWCASPTERFLVRLQEVQELIHPAQLTGLLWAKSPHKNKSRPGLRRLEQ